MTPYSPCIDFLVPVDKQSIPADPHNDESAHWHIELPHSQHVPLGGRYAERNSGAAAKYMYAYVYIYIYVCVCRYVRECISMYIYMHTVLYRKIINTHTYENVNVHGYSFRDSKLTS